MTTFWTRPRLVLAVMILTVAFPGSLNAADIAIVPVRVPGNVFGDADGSFTLRVDSKKAAKGRFVGSLTLGNATVAAREAAWTADPQTPATIEFKVQIPPVKNGIVLQARLSAAVFEGNENKASDVFGQDVWIFPKDPFVDRGEWLKDLKLRLYDPVKVTAKALAALNVPLEEIANMGALSDLTDGTLLIGEGVSFKEEPGLSEAMLKCSVNGTRVLCLAPAAGEMAVPGLGRSAQRLRDLTFQRDPTQRLDKRIDLPAPTTTFQIHSVDGVVVAEPTAGAEGWSWMEARATHGSGHWAACTLPIVSQWETGPAARFLFARMLDHLNPADKARPLSKENP